MADYNVNMKQWNGTSFDNVLPLAYNAKQLGGQSLAEVKQWVQDNNLLLYSGQYIGTGYYGISNPTSITFPFEPILFISPITAYEDYPASSLINTRYLTTSYKQVGCLRGVSSDGVPSGRYLMARFSDSSKTTLQIYSEDSDFYQGNISGEIYYFAAIGGYDMDRQIEWTITSSGSWTVPKTGRYMLELYGGGGGTFRSISSSGYTGGASCQHYDSISLTKGENINTVIGSGGFDNDAGGTTSFGSYSVSGGGGTDGDSSGAKAGNYGAAGVRRNRNQSGNVYGTGVFSNIYGYGSDRRGDNGGPGAVYLKYLGA